MIMNEFADEERRQWFADKQARRDEALKALVTEADPKMQRKLRASARRYNAIAMGPERTRAASSHPNYARRYTLFWAAGRCLSVAAGGGGHSDKRTVRGER